MVLLLAPALAGCQFSFSAGGPDYEKLENAIASELNKNYAAISREVSAVECPRPAQAPKTGDTFICNADVDGHKVRVEATVTDDDYHIDFHTRDIVYDLSEAGSTLSRSISDEYGFAVTVACGDGLHVVEAGHSFECTATDPTGDTRTVKVTAGAVGEDDQWEVVE
jgi:Domain of unknown function (DUF4333)